MRSSRFLSRRSRLAFTLVELLVVIGIVALLIALLLPALTGAREVANRAKCLSNLRSMAQAAHLHAAEHRGYMPAAGVCISANAGIYFGADGLGDRDRRKYIYRGEGVPVTLPEALGYYMGLRDLVDARPHGARGEQYLAAEPFRSRFTCPSQDPDSIRPGYTRGDDYHPTIGPRVLMSYIFNGSFLARRKYPEGVTPAGRVDKVSDPSSVFLFADGLSGEATEDYAVHGNPGGSTLGDTLANGSYLFDRSRHRSWMNVVFVDGHAETLMMWDRKRPAGRDYGNVGELDRAWVSKGLILQ